MKAKYIHLEYKITTFKLQNPNLASQIKTLKVNKKIIKIYFHRIEKHKI